MSELRDLREFIGVGGSVVVRSTGLDYVRPEMKELLKQDVPFATPSAHKVAVKCSREGCGHVTVHPLGTLNPAEGRCEHEFQINWMTFKAECLGCSVSLDIHKLTDLLDDSRLRPVATHNMLMADELQTLKDENTQLHAELSKLQRRLVK